MKNNRKYVWKNVKPSQIKIIVYRTQPKNKFKAAVILTLFLLSWIKFLKFYTKDVYFYKNNFLGCLPLTTPNYTIVTCNKGKTIGSTCSYQCQSGYTVTVCKIKIYFFNKV